MFLRHPLGRGLLCAALLPAILPAQQFQRVLAGVPASTGSTENVDFADVDNDGDWDAAFANGGDFGNQQSVLWQNQGGAQAGTLGVFVNVTATQFPALPADSRDLEFADIDGDTDVDLYLANTSTIINQPCRWWVNMGVYQGGTMGFFQDQTATRWVGLGGPGSSMPPGQVIPGGGFVDFSCDADFADFDNDGDLDLVHSTPGSAFSGNAPTRIFLNDGLGNFREFNPSGFQLPGSSISNGHPGLWCEGVQTANTTNSTGTNCDIATSGVDVEVADIDGDYDLDILLGARQELPRMFQNRYAENVDLPGFRDVTGSAFPPGYSTGAGHYEQEMGDMDGDGDWDILGLNWLVSVNFNDATYFNNGLGVFSAPTTLPGSGADDSEVDYLDYDEDGDLDLFIANFSGQERIYQNSGGGAFALIATGVALPPDSTTSLDADTCDVDSDGDTDVFVANDSGQAEWFLRNTAPQADATAPLVTRVEQAPNRSAGPRPTVVRAEVQDDANYYTTWYERVALRVQVNGGAPVSYPMRASMGQVFRGEIPGNLVGAISYRVTATDEHGNTSTSAIFGYTASAGATLGSALCFGDGTQPVPCPCANSGSAGHGCANSVAPAGALLEASGSVLPDSVALQASSLPASTLTVFLQGGTALPSAAPFGDGLRCAGALLVRLYVIHAIASVAVAPWPGAPGIRLRSSQMGDPLAPGSARVYQAWYRDSDALFCPGPTGGLHNISQAIAITW